MVSPTVSSVYSDATVLTRQISIHLAGVGLHWIWRQSVQVAWQMRFSRNVSDNSADNPDATTQMPRSRCHDPW